MDDGTDKLCKLLYGETKTEHYLGGSEAGMLYDAAAEIERLHKRAADLGRMLVDIKGDTWRGRAERAESAVNVLREKYNELMTFVKRASEHDGDGMIDALPDEESALGGIISVAEVAKRILAGREMCILCGKRRVVVPGESVARAAARRKLCWTCFKSKKNWRKAERIVGMKGENDD